MSFRYEVARRLLEARLAHQARVGRMISQSEVARAIGTKPQNLSSWELGNSRPSLEHLAALGAFYGVPAGWLAFGSPYPRERNGVNQTRSGSDRRNGQEPTDGD